MRVLVACEFSGVVRDAFATRGHDAWSCDTLPSAASGRHIQDDVRNHLHRGWDLVVAHPPCTYLCSSGLHWNKRVPGRDALTDDALAFFMIFVDCAPKWAIENPIGCVSTRWRKPDQIIQPWQFGTPHSKATCLWLGNLPLLTPTHVLPKPASGRRENQTPSGQNNLGPSPLRAMQRSITYPGIADAMAEQWG